MKKSTLLAFLPIVVIIAIPLILRKPAEAIDLSADQLVIVSPHNESIRYEFEQAFRKYYHEKTGRKVSIDWRATGGTSDIVRYINSAFTSNFKVYWTNDLKREWNDDVANSFLNPKVKPEESEARKCFLESDLGIGIDILFGGGQYDLAKQANMGTVVPCGLRDRHPELFAGDSPILVEKLGGEIWYDSQDRYYGACFSSFGICANYEKLKSIGYDISSQPITSWRDLADPRMFGAVGVADPSKSGSINKCFEMIIQRQMQDTYARLAADVAAGKMTETDAVNQSWQEALALVKSVGGNALYLTMSASKVPVDTASGQVAAGMCIDFYGRSQAEWEESHVGRKTMTYYTPDAGSTVSVDPIGMFRGAPNPERARLFIRYLLTAEGQRLWNQRAGTEGGPIKYTLHRLPVRRDSYTEECRKLMSAPDADPFGLSGSFTYKGAWTGPYFDLIRTLIRVMVLDCRDELQASWKAIIDAGGPEAVPQAYVEFCRLPFKHSEGGDTAKKLWVAETQTVTTREWAIFFRESYGNALKLAKEGK